MQLHCGTVDLYRFNDFLLTYLLAQLHGDSPIGVQTTAEPVSQLDLLILSGVFSGALCDQTVASSQSESSADQSGSTWAACTCLRLR